MARSVLVAELAPRSAAGPGRRVAAGRRLVPPFLAAGPVAVPSAGLLGDAPSIRSPVVLRGLPAALPGAAPTAPLVAARLSAPLLEPLATTLTTGAATGLVPVVSPVLAGVRLLLSATPSVVASTAVVPPVSMRLRGAAAFSRSGLTAASVVAAGHPATRLTGPVRGHLAALAVGRPSAPEPAGLLALAGQLLAFAAATAPLLGVSPLLAVPARLLQLLAVAVLAPLLVSAGPSDLVPAASSLLTLLTSLSVLSVLTLLTLLSAFAPLTPRSAPALLSALTGLVFAALLALLAPPLLLVAVTASAAAAGVPALLAAPLGLVLRRLCTLAGGAIVAPAARSIPSVLPAALPVAILPLWALLQIVRPVPVVGVGPLVAALLAVAPPVLPLVSELAPIVLLSTLSASMSLVVRVSCHGLTLWTGRSTVLRTTGHERP